MRLYKTKLLTLSTLFLFTACGSSERNENTDPKDEPKKEKQEVAAPIVVQAGVCTQSERRSIIASNNILNTRVIDLREHFYKELRIAIEDLSIMGARQAGSVFENTRNNLDILINSGVLHQINCKLNSVNDSVFNIEGRISQLTTLKKEIEVQIIAANQLKNLIAAKIYEGLENIPKMAEKNNIDEKEIYQRNTA